jgi:hypothetical protein
MNAFIHNRQFRTLASASFLSSIGSVLFNFVFLIYAQTLPDATFALSMVTMANLLPSLVQIVSGHLADNTNPHARLRLLTGMRLAQGSLYLLLAWIIGFHATAGIFWALVAINVGSDLIADYTNGLSMHYLQQLFSEREDMQAAAGFLSGVGETISIVFQAVGAGFIVLLNHNYALFGLINALSFFVAGALLLAHRRTFKQADALAAARFAALHQSTEGRAQTSFTAAFKNLAKNHPLMRMMFLGLLVNVFGTSLEGLTNITLAGEHGLWFGNFGNTVALISVVTSLAVIAASLLTVDPMQKMALPGLVMVTMLGLMLFSCNMIFWQNRIVMLATLVLAAYPLGKVNPRLSSEIMTIVVPEQLATVSSVLGTLLMAGAPIGTVVFLGVANVANATLAWIVFGSGALLATGIAGLVAWLDRKEAAGVVATSSVRVAAK